MMSSSASVAVVLVCVLSSCGDEPEPVARSTASEGTPAAESSSTQPGPTSEPPPNPSKSSTPQADDPQILIGTVGEPDDPEAFTISLQLDSGKPVDRIEPGAYLVRVTDPARYHNFHLTGPGVDERTSVFAKTKVQWKLTLKPGTYTFVCDPHPQMVGEVVVSGQG